jgi:hypothetical protein
MQELNVDIYIWDISLLSVFEGYDKWEIRERADTGPRGLVWYPLLLPPFLHFSTCTLSGHVFGRGLKKNSPLFQDKIGFFFSSYFTLVHNHLHCTIFFPASDYPCIRPWKWWLGEWVYWTKCMSEAFWRSFTRWLAHYGWWAS